MGEQIILELSNRFGEEHVSSVSPPIVIDSLSLSHRDINKSDISSLTPVVGNDISSFYS